MNNTNKKTLKSFKHDSVSVLKYDLLEKLMSNCIHSESLVDISQIVRILDFSSKKKNKCLKCHKSKKNVDEFCFCLHCGDIFCSGPDKSHLYNHIIKKPMHYLFINTKNISIYCCICNNEISFEKNKSLEVKELQRIIERKFFDENVKNKKKCVKSKECSFKYISLVPGLENLGNTCYFNSVMQVLAASCLLHDIISSTPFSTPIFSQINGKGSLISAFIEYLEVVYSCTSKNIIFKPQKLFSQVQNRHKQFQSYEQQDAHELLRYFLDSLNMEELSNTCNKNVTEKSLRQKQKAFGKNDITFMTSIKNENLTENNSDTQENITFVDKLFGGRLASVVVCDTCKSVSMTYEKFQDISLSINTLITDDSNQVNRKSNWPKKTKKKDKNHLHHNSQISRSYSNDCLENVFDEGGSLSPKSLENIVKTSIDFKQLSVDSFKKDMIDMYKDDFAISGISTAIDETSKYIDLLLFEKNTVDYKKKGSWDLEDSLRQFTSVEVMENENSFACEECAKRFHSGKKNDICISSKKKWHDFQLPDSKLSKNCKVLIRSDVSFKFSCHLSDLCIHASNGSNVKCKTRSFFFNLPNSSIHSSLDDRHSSNHPKSFLSKAFKRFLIDMPLPPILILHLKRFQQTGRVRSLKKIDTFVDFPATLDLTDYVTPRLRYGPGLLYSLTGVIVHIGNYTHGHYACYILTHKIQPLHESMSTSSINSNNPIRQWVFANDTETRPATWDEVRRSSGYIFVYEQIHS
ncbi:hypothetical protein PNEG_00643 [Pneumocystis murina B123]|uniref:Ubiquitin carboxyl-terminal hydrolase n=1 Tax=Pneumocystis murina (strain B123) TaxID=1069680 RepID=M7PAZ1_PNEMU|nr:hypothetical protein PNEG_00643 [Pneumocystis murina B123]EMR11045.2 hypothetical protein PNEG_00643 [Pneumocystis murina B123]